MKISPASLSFVTLFLLHAPATAEKPVDQGLAVSDAGGENTDFFSQIVGGEPADAGEFRFMVSWHNDLSEKPSCGASLVAPNIVLSAAHCYNVPGNMRVGSIKAKSTYDGNPPGVEVEAIEKIKHPDYNFPDNDFMLLELKEAIDTSVYPPIELNFDPSKPATGADLTVIGFGTLQSGGNQPNELMKVDVPAVSHQVCSQQYSGLTEDIHLCAGFTEGGKDSCQGDSGGPIFEEIGGVLKQVGVVSFGEGCAKAGKSGIYARVSGAQHWLTEEICNRSVQPKPSFCDGFQPTTAPPTTTPDCWDSPVGWHDGDGPEYSCEWYADGDNCETYGDLFPNDGTTANEACCICGGGVPTTAPPAGQPVTQPVPQPVPQPVEPPIGEPTEWETIFVENFVGEGISDYFSLNNRIIIPGNPNHGQDYTSSAKLRKSSTLKTLMLSSEDYSELVVDFWAQGGKLEDGDGFVLKFKFGTNGWTEVGSWSFGDDFENDVWTKLTTATIDVPVNSDERVKFKFVAGNDHRSDQIFIDDVTFSGKD